MDNNSINMNGESLDVAAKRREELKQLFPGVFTETKDEDGNAISSIDVERLKAELGTISDVYEGRRERYGMEWPGKRDCMKIIQEPSRATLKPCSEESVNWDISKNLFIEGDNLEVLKLLQKSYYGKVKMIYVDPPYNTGNEFIYPDNYQDTLDTYLAYSGLVDDSGRAFTTNTAAEGRYHTKWLNMMFTRLFLSRNLLKDDGVIFVSIDSNEFSNLKKLLDEIYGEENFLVDLVWEKTRKNDAKFFSNGHEYILVYAKNLSYLKEKGIVFREEKPGAQEIYSKFNELRTKFGNDFQKIELELKAFYQGLPKDHPAKKHSRYNKVDSKGVWRDDNMSWPGGNGPDYDVIHPETGKPCAVPPGGWRFSTPEKMAKMIEKGVVVFRDDHTQPPIRKTYLVRDSIAGEEDIGKQVMGSYFYKSALSANTALEGQVGKNVFENPKDADVIKRLIKYVCKEDLTFPPRIEP
ncbi:site-specific DNA-methyltransferase [Pseudidiomarina sp. 1APR75-33.1]|uniref:site-specific DNA-methyltransferase n=1 Tax=Pseudidiomarina terrestris TaxID=2820060 RepID=UPI0026556ADD|nr:site-specific DNA-methyltransferase [Pseudidiomarina sp. 1APR75-33.1]MDN7126412.1 site-specific DNA-methyltransferase [Pseudidiomarina sp. 1APR75-33.1]